MVPCEHLRLIISFLGMVTREACLNYIGSRKTNILMFELVLLLKMYNTAGTYYLIKFQVNFSNVSITCTLYLCLLLVPCSNLLVLGAVGCHEDPAPYARSGACSTPLLRV